MPRLISFILLFGFASSSFADRACLDKVTAASRKYSIDCMAPDDANGCNDYARQFMDEWVKGQIEICQGISEKDSLPDKPRPPATPRATARSPAPATTTPAAPAAVTSGDPEGDARRDLDSCEKLRSEAARCCGRATACSSEMDSDDQLEVARLLSMSQSAAANGGVGIGSVCGAMGSLQGSRSSANLGGSVVCNKNKKACQSSCGRIAERYRDKLASSAASQYRSLYQKTLNQIEDNVAECKSSKASVAMGIAGVQEGADQSIAAACQVMTSGAVGEMLNARQDLGAIPNLPPANTYGSGPNDPYGCMANPGSASCVNCTANAQLPACRAMAQGHAPLMGKSAFAGPNGAAATVNKDNQFNPSELNDGSTMQMAAVKPRGEKVTGVPNNSGGQIPGSGNDQGKAKLDALAVHGPGGPTTNTDILGGEKGFGQPAGVDASAVTFAGYGGAKDPAEAKGKQAGLDLKKYLPGGEFDRSVAALGGARVEINGRGGDIFKRISAKITEKCRLGILWECHP